MRPFSNTMIFLFSKKNNNNLYFLGNKKKIPHSIIKHIIDDGTLTLSEAKSQKLTYYFNNKMCKKKHKSIRYVSSGCLLCLREKNRKSSKNRPKTKAFLEKERKRKRESYLKNREKTLKARKEYRKNNPESEFARRCLERTLSGVNLGNTDYFSILGYDKVTLKNHIQSLFKEGMSWLNYGEWHIDHIKPIKQFILEGETDPKIINALSNLQPLWAKENLSKGAKYSI